MCIFTTCLAIHEQIYIIIGEVLVYHLHKSYFPLGCEEIWVNYAFVYWYLVYLKKICDYYDKIWERLYIRCSLKVVMKKDCLCLTKVIK